MARPLQKKKNKSSLNRVRRKPKSKRINIKSNPIVAAKWYDYLSSHLEIVAKPIVRRDQSLTLSQNYRRLGLSSKLNAYTGGTEAKAKSTASESRRKDALSIPSLHKDSEMRTSEVKVTRDPKTGAIVSVQHEKSERENPLGDPLNEISDFEEEEIVEDSRRGVVSELEEQAKYSKPKRPRMQSQREREWIERLVERWGDDWGGMVMDRKLNPQQQS